MASTEDKPANKENTSSWKDSIYNPRTGELLGRTASSWGKDPPPPPLFSTHLGHAFTFTVLFFVFYFVAVPPNLTPSHVPYISCSPQLSLPCVPVHGWM